MIFSYTAPKYFMKGSSHIKRCAMAMDFFLRLIRLNIQNDIGFVLALSVMVFKIYPSVFLCHRGSRPFCRVVRPGK